MIGKRQRIAGRYLLESEIGSGGMGVVWQAWDERLNRDVAVKVLAPSAVGNEVARARLIREARAAGRLQHEGIVHVYDVGETDDGGAFLVMELISGHGLRSWIEQGKLSIPARIELVTEIAAALSCAHDLGIVHRDVKPDNVLVRSTGRPVLLDFGLAKPVPSALAGDEQQSRGLTATGNIVGTPAYLAPEQVTGGEIGPAADQFALAVMTFELLTGRLPWNGNTVIEVVASMLHDRPASAEELVPELPAGIDDVLHRALKKEPAERFPSLEALVEALCQLFPDIRAPHFSTLPPLRLDRTPSADRLKRELGSAETGLAKKVSTAPASRKKLSWMVGLALGLSAIVGAGVMLERSSKSGPRSTALATTGAALTPDTVVACPLFKVAGESLEPSTGWLAAAAAALTCDRVQALLGGASSRTLAPAELVSGIPREPTANAPSDPFAPDGLTERTLATAKQRAGAYLDGSLTKTPTEFAVELTLRARDGRSLGAASGRAEELFEAVSAAVRELRPAFGDGSASAFQKEWLRVQTTEAAVDVLDVTTALLIEADLATKRACDRAGKQRALRPEMSYLLRAICSERLMRTPLSEAPPPIDESSPGALTTTIAAHRARGGVEETKKRVELLRQVQPTGKDPDQRAIISVTAAELLYNVGDLLGAQSAARIAAQASPKLIDPRGTPWHRLAFTAEFDRAISRVHAAWIPWEPTALVNGNLQGNDFANRARLSARAYLLCQHGFYAGTYAELLAMMGKTEEARNIAEQHDDDYLRVRAYSGATRYKRAMQYAIEALAKLEPLDINAGKAYRLAAAGAEAARYQGLPATFVDGVVARFLDVEPPHIRVGVSPFFSLLYACLEAPKPVARRCLHRLRQVYERGDAGAVVSAVPAVLEGAEHWIAGDAHGAAKSWRPLLRHGGTMGDGPMRHILSTALDRAGMSDIAERADASYVQLVDQSGAADLAFARSARRAEKSGDRERARKLAQACVERWQHADEDVPARSEMQALLARLESK